MDIMLLLEDIKKTYGPTVALHDLDLRINAGEIHGLIGPNGAGKTTTMRIIMGLVDPDYGTATWKGAGLDADLRRSFGYMPEERGLYQRQPVRDQLVYFARLYGLSRASAIRDIESLAESLDFRQLLSRTLGSLSLGNQQKIQLASALLGEPPLLVLDEPFSGLDPSMVERLVALLRLRAGHGTAILFSSHQLSLVEGICDEVSVVAQGSVVAAGPVASLTTPDPTHCYVQVLSGSDLMGSAVRVIQTLPNGALLLEGPEDRLAELVGDLAKSGRLLGYERFGVSLEQRFSVLMEEMQ